VKVAGKSYFSRPSRQALKNCLPRHIPRLVRAITHCHFNASRDINFKGFRLIAVLTVEIAANDTLEGASHPV